MVKDEGEGARIGSGSQEGKGEGRGPGRRVLGCSHKDSSAKLMGSP